jgi:3-deoxy-D-manno-octulosonate 8-phosphate phosphatase (KDO 8-P phosphatase)
MPHAPASDVVLLALDVDGVMTDGSIILSDLGHESKRFNVRDGFGIRLWGRMGFTTAIITGRSGEALRHRAKELEIPEVIQGCKDKVQAALALGERLGVPLSRMAFVGDDWPDAGVMQAVGYPIAVADADPWVKEIAAYTTAARGGRGAVREAVEHLLEAKGMLHQARQLFVGGTA